MSSVPRIRRSLAELEYLYASGQDPSLLENVIRAFRGIMDKPHEDPNSFFMLAGFHGEPFRGKGVNKSEYWGGYCHHDNVLFPTWHRAYLMRFEDALRTVPGCEDVTLPFWDQLVALDDAKGSPSTPSTWPATTLPLWPGAGDGKGTPIPSVLTTPTFPLDGRNDNPLYSYKLQQKIQHKSGGGDEHRERYTKHEGYETVRFPLSGLVGTEKDRKETEAHNSTYADKATAMLNENVSSWLEGTIAITPDPKAPDMPETYSVAGRYKRCLDAPNYTVFSNVKSQNAWICEHVSQCTKTHSPDDKKPPYVVSLESPHNAIHLAVGGFYQETYVDEFTGKRHTGYKTNDLTGANGDMGCNEMAGFDPIFYLHHCFVDYVFWVWQKRNGFTRPGSLEVIAGYEGTMNETGLPDIEPGTHLEMQTPLYPFTKHRIGTPRGQDEGSAPGDYLTSDDVVDIENQLGYSYGPGSLDSWMSRIQLVTAPLGGTAPITGYKHLRGIDRSDYAGSFVLRIFARCPAGGADGEGKKVEIGREAVLSRWSVEGCANCQAHLMTELIAPVYEPMKEALRGPGGEDEDVEYDFEIQTAEGTQRRQRLSLPGGPRVTGPKGILEDLVPGN